MSCAELVADPAILQHLVSLAAACLSNASREGGCDGVEAMGHDFTAASPQP